MDKEIEIPFGAKDSELKGWEYTVPEGMKARIEGNKIILEPKESEDERIRKGLINTIEFYGAAMNSPYLLGIEKKDIIAWLEKQGGHIKFLESIQIGDKVTRNPDGVLVNLSQLKRMAEKGSQNLANSAKTCKDEPRFKVGDKIIDKSFKKNVFTVTEVINNGIAYVDESGERFTKYYDEDDWDEYELVEQNPAWSDEDEKMIEFWNLYYEHKVGDMPNKDVVENLEKFRDWLKFLKERYTWKPSDGQLRELRCVINGCSFETPILVELEEQLKKL